MELTIKESCKTEILKCLQRGGFADLQATKDFCLSHGVDVEQMVKEIQPIAFDDAVCAYMLGTALALKSTKENASELAKEVGVGLQAFCTPGSVAANRKVGIGHGNLAALLLSEQASCFCFLAGHESFAAAEGALGIVKAANKVRKKPLRVVLNGLGKDAAYIISRINGFTYVKTSYDFEQEKLVVQGELCFSNSERSEIKVYGAHDVLEGVAIMELEDVDASITGNSTNPVRFQHLVAGIYKKERLEKNLNYFSVASGGGTGRTLHPDNVAAGPASYGLTDSMGRMHCDVQFAGSSSVPAHVEMMGFIGMGNNPIVGATVSCAVAVAKQKLNERGFNNEGV